MEPKANDLPKKDGETINLSGDYPLEVLSYYIWGRNKRPEGDEIVNEYYANRKYGDKNINLNFSKQKYLEKFFGIDRLFKDGHLNPHADRLSNFTEIANMWFYFQNTILKTNFAKRVIC